MTPDKLEGWPPDEQAPRASEPNLDPQAPALALWAQSAELEVIYQSAHVGLCVFDHRLRYVRINDRLAEINGIPAADHIAKTARQVVPDLADTAEKIAARVFQTGQPVLNVEFSGTTPAQPDVQRYWIEHWLPLKDANGNVIGINVTAEEITERKQAEEALRKLNATLERKVAQRTVELEHRTRQLQELTLELSQAEDRERRRLADILHEDLQQHLSAMKFHLAAMKSRAKADPAQQAIIAQLDRMLLEAIEKSSGVSHDLSPATLALPDLAQTFRWLADRHQSRYRLRVHVTGGAEIEPGALKSFLYKVGRELLFNVVKHADVTDARLRLRRLGPYISLTVSDQGRGFILETLHDTAGFGLLRIREQVTLLGGRLTIRTAPGAGTRLRITLPVAP